MEWTFGSVIQREGVKAMIVGFDTHDLIKLDDGYSGIGNWFALILANETAHWASLYPVGGLALVDHSLTDWTTIE